MSFDSGVEIQVPALAMHRRLVQYARAPKNGQAGISMIF